jgi:hypothetical protein
MQFECAHHRRVIHRGLEPAVDRRHLIEHAEGAGRAETAEAQRQAHDAFFIGREIDQGRVATRGVDPVPHGTVTLTLGLDLETEFSNSSFVALELLSHGTLVAFVRQNLARSLGRDRELVDLEFTHDLLLGERAVLPRTLEQQDERNQSFARLLNPSTNSAHRSPVTFATTRVHKNGQHTNL